MKLNVIFFLLSMSFFVSAQDYHHISPPKTYWKSYGFQKQPDHAKIAYYKSDSLGYEPVMTEVYSFNKDGHIIQDDNLLACSEQHIRKVFNMLKRQKEKARFSGGLEAKLLKEWHVELFSDLKPQSMYFAYDTADDYEPLVEAGKLLKKAGITLKTRIPQAFVLMGYKGDTIEKAEKRCIQCLEAGFIPFAMLYKNDKGEEDPSWKQFQRVWARQAIIYTKYKQYFKEDT